jgi:hypothetical protein
MWPWMVWPLALVLDAIALAIGVTDLMTMAGPMVKS